MRIFLCFAEAQRDGATALAANLQREGYQVWADPAGYPAGRSELERLQKAIGKADLFLFLLSSESVARGSATLTALKIAGERWPAPEGRVLLVTMVDVAPAALPAYLGQSETAPAEPAALVAALRRLEASLARTASRRLQLAAGLVGMLVVVFAITLAGIRLAGPPDVSPDVTPQFHIRPQVGYAEWLGQARFELVNTREAPGLDYYCKVVYPKDNPSITAIDYDRRCREIIVKAGMGPFVDANGKVTRIGHYDPERSGIEVRVFDQHDTLIWQAPLLYGGMNPGIGFEIVGLREDEGQQGIAGKLLPTYEVRIGEEHSFELLFKGTSLSAGFLVKARPLVPDQMIDWGFRQGPTPTQILFRPQHTEIAKRLKMGRLGHPFQGHIVLDIEHESGYKTIHQFSVRMIAQ